MTLAWLTRWTGKWATGYFLLLWILPLFTSFAVFMILRQWVQHGNGDRGWLMKLHDALMEYPEYREEAVVVEGYLAPRYVGQKNLTVLDVLGPVYSPHTGEVYIDHSVMDDSDFEE